LDEESRAFEPSSALIPDPAGSNCYGTLNVDLWIVFQGENDDADLEFVDFPKSVVASN
jgi:hypothetical protein